MAAMKKFYSSQHVIQDLFQAMQSLEEQLQDLNLEICAEFNRSWFKQNLDLSSSLRDWHLSINATKSWMLVPDSGVFKTLLCFEKQCQMASDAAFLMDADLLHRIQLAATTCDLEVDFKLGYLVVPVVFFNDINLIVVGQSSSFAPSEYEHLLESSQRLLLALRHTVTTSPVMSSFFQGQKVAS